MGKYAEQFPNLKYLLSAYFHEDMFDGFEWKNEKPSYQTIIKYFKTHDSPARNQKILGELKEFLKISRDWDEDELENVLLNNFGNFIYAPGVGITYSEFLERILEILEEPTEKTRSEFIPKFVG